MVDNAGTQDKNNGAAAAIAKEDTSSRVY